MKRTMFTLLILVVLVVLGGAVSYVFSPEQRAIRHTVAFVRQHPPDPASTQFSGVGNYHREGHDWVVCGWIGPKDLTPQQFMVYHDRQTGADHLVARWNSPEDLDRRWDASCGSKVVWTD